MPSPEQHPETIYPLLFRTSAAALQQLAQDPRFLGGQIGMLGVLQTWTRDLRYHPHVHYLVPALALTPDGKRWLVGKQRLSGACQTAGQAVSSKVPRRVASDAVAGQVDARVWAKSWVVDCRPVGSGLSALKYLAPYIFRIALSNNRIEQVANDAVTFRYTEGKTGAQKRATLPVDTFIGRFLAHVLPKGFVKVRYYGLLRSEQATLAGGGAEYPGTAAGSSSATACGRSTSNRSWRCQSVSVVARHVDSRCSWFRRCHPSGSRSGW